MDPTHACPGRTASAEHHVPYLFPDHRALCAISGTPGRQGRTRAVRVATATRQIVKALRALSPRAGNFRLRKKEEVCAMTDGLPTRCAR